MELSILLPALNEAENLKVLIPKIHEQLKAMGLSYEIIVVNGPSTDGTEHVAAALGAQVIQQREPGYGGALLAGFTAAQGAYLITMDADLSHDPALIPELWQALHRHNTDVVIASRYIRGGESHTQWLRKFLSVILNQFLSRLLASGVRDLSSGFRLYRAEVVKTMQPERRDFAILIEILMRAYAAGYAVTEIPLCYHPRRHGDSHAQILRFGLGYLKTFSRMWLLRNSIACADYDARAYESWIPLQRFWQRRRFHIITQAAQGTTRVLDVGCGSSKILDALPGQVVGLDIQLNKLRYQRRHAHAHLVLGDIIALPFPDASFDCVICSQVIEHIPQNPLIFEELVRVLQPGGKLILGTPDYGTWIWPLIEQAYKFFAPNAYADEHISHYTRRGLIKTLEGHHLRIESIRTILEAELVIVARK